jgi:hypothetical protein
MFADHSYYFLSKNLPTNLLRVILRSKILWLRWADFIGILQYYLICEWDFFMHRRGRRERRGGEKRECFRSVDSQSTAQLISHLMSARLTIISRSGRVFEIVNYWQVLLANPPLQNRGRSTGHNITPSLLLGSKIYLASRSDSEHYERKLSFGCSYYHFPDIVPLSLNSSRLTRAS